MRSMALAALCGVFVTCAAVASDTGTANETKPQSGHRIAIQDINKLKAQISTLQEMGDQIAANREAFRKVKAFLEQQGFHGQRFSAQNARAFSQVRWEKQWQTDWQRDAERRYQFHSSMQRAQRQFTPTRANYFQRVAQRQQQNGTAAMFPDWSNTQQQKPTINETKKPFSNLRSERKPTPPRKKHESDKQVTDSDSN